MNPPDAPSAPTTPAQLAAQCGDQMPLPLANDDGMVFAEPWQAHAFAITLQLHERGLFAWSEWAASLAGEIRSAQVAGDPDDGSTYYRHWLNALEKLIVAKRIGTPEQIHNLEHAWERAASRTPHGQPIELKATELLSDM